MTARYLGRLSAAYDPLSAELARVRAAGIGAVVRIGPLYRPVLVERVREAGELVYVDFREMWASSL